MNAVEAKEMVLKICEMEIASRDELCRLDSFVGDGDHGYTVEKGFTAVWNMLQQKEFSTPGEVFEKAGETLAASLGGAIGLILGSFFSGGARRLSGKDRIDMEDFGNLLEDGLDEIKEVGGAKEGDRTLVDALSPAAKAYRAKAEQGGNLEECLSEAAKAAGEGAQNTASMVARKGRAKFLGEKSRGHVDAGATTMKILLETMSSFVNQG